VNEKHIEIQQFFKLDNKIKRLNERMNDLERSLYNRTLATHIVYSGLDIHVEAPRIDMLLDDIEGAKEYVSHALEITIFKYQAFNQCLQSFSKADYWLMIQYFKYERTTSISKDIIEQLQDEIYEIETAAAYRYGLEFPKEPLKLSDDVSNNIDRLVAFLEG
jgi:hypothetical protein